MDGTVEHVGEHPHACARAACRCWSRPCRSALAAAGCGALGYTSARPTRQNGKKLVRQGRDGKASCGSCHTLADAGTTGTIGPNLDAAFEQALKVGMTEGTIRQVVRGQIAYAIDDDVHRCSGHAEEPRHRRRRARRRRLRRERSGQGHAVRAAPSPSPTPAPTPTPTPEPSGGSHGSGGGTPAQLAAGKKVFLEAGGCGACHTLEGRRRGGTVGPKLDNVAADAQKAGKALDAYVERVDRRPERVRRPGFPKGVMPPDFTTTLTAAADRRPHRLHRRGRRQA